MDTVNAMPAKVTACMQNDVPGFEYGGCYADMFTRNYGMQWNASSMAWFWGMRCLMAAAANRIFDDPFIPVIKQSDFNADPRRIGIWAMGPYLFAIARWLARLCRSCEDMGLKNWMDNQDVCDVLHISKKTLQVYRDKGLLPFTRIKHKMFYKPEDVHNLLESNYHPLKRKP